MYSKTVKMNNKEMKSKILNTKVNPSLLRICRINPKCNYRKITRQNRLLMKKSTQ